MVPILYTMCNAKPSKQFHLSFYVNVHYDLFENINIPFYVFIFLGG